VKVASAIEFFREARAEAAKVVWPSRRETIITTVMVFLMCAFAAVFFSLVDYILSTGVGLLLG
jgi:preprotein translocase subunit SecE